MVDKIKKDKKNANDTNQAIVDDKFAKQEKVEKNKSVEVKKNQDVDKNVEEQKRSEETLKSVKDNIPATGKNMSKTLTANKSKQKKPNDNEKKTFESKKNQNEINDKVLDQNEFIEKLVSINRVAKVVKGGRRFSFAALVVVGDGNGMVGHGKGKAKEVPEAIKKATDEAKNNMIRVPLRQGRTLHHDIKGRFDSGKVYLRSAPSGTGVIAGGPMRAVFEALGIQDIVAKSVGTSNPHNMIRATFEALRVASSPKIIAMRRGLKINDITKRRKISQPGSDNVKN